MSEELTIRKTQSGKGYTLGFIPQDHFKPLIGSDFVQYFPSKTKDGEIRKTKTGKDRMVTYVKNEDFDRLKTYCTDNDISIEITEPTTQ